MEVATFSARHVNENLLFLLTTEHRLQKHLILNPVIVEITHGTHVGFTERSNLPLARIDHLARNIVARLHKCFNLRLLRHLCALANHGWCNRLVDTVPCLICNKLRIHGSLDRITNASSGLAELLRLIVTDAHRNPAPSRLIARLVAHLYDASVLNNFTKFTRDIVHVLKFINFTLAIGCRCKCIDVVHR